jgi:hypothetical protein
MDHFFLPASMGPGHLFRTWPVMLSLQLVFSAGKPDVLPHDDIWMTR